MILYNVTVKLDKEIENEWVKWMKDVHIPDVLSTKIFSENKLCKILIDETDGVTYSVQYICNGIEDFNKYQREFAAKLQKEHTEKYKNRFVAFRTLMEILD